MSEDVRNELSTPSRVRARFARFGATRPAGNPVLEPLMTAVRQNHPKADPSVIERAYAVAEHAHDGQMRKSGDADITPPPAVTTHPPQLRMAPPTPAAALLPHPADDHAYRP